MDTKELLKKRRLLKKKKPEFVMQDAHKKDRLASRWRKPRGSDSKMRVGKKGYRRSVRVGWGSPSEVRGLSRQGLAEVKVENLKDLDKADPKTDMIIISSSVGAKKRVEIIEAAQGKGLQIANYKDASAFVKKVKDEFDKKKADKKKVKEAREKKREDAKKQADKKKAKEEKEKKEKESASEQTDEEKKAEEKKEQDKVLISKQ